MLLESKIWAWYSTIFGLAHPYQDVLRELRDDLTVIDTAGVLLDNDVQQLFIDDQFGGHYNPEGNRIIADFIARHVKALPPHKIGESDEQDPVD